MYQALPALPYCKWRKAGRRTGNEANVFVDPSTNCISAAVSQPQESAHTYNLGFPVKLLREAWYHTGITRETAEGRLEHATNGCFLVRESETRPGRFSLSLKHPEGIVHFPIERQDSGLNEVPGTHKGFTTIPELVDYFTHHSISEDPYHLLSSPCLKAPPNGKWKWCMAINHKLFGLLFALTTPQIKPQKSPTPLPLPPSLRERDSSNKESQFQFPASSAELQGNTVPKQELS